MALSPTESRRWTYEDYLQLPDDGKRYEIIDGELFEMPAPTLSHQTVSKRLQHELYRLELQGLGQMFDAPFDLKILGGTPVQPDLVFLTPDLLGHVKNRALEGPPALVVEILSPGTARRDRTKKLRLYARNRIPLYWIADPQARTLEVLRLQGDLYQVEAALAVGEVYDSPDFLGLTLDLGELFRDLPLED